MSLCCEPRPLLHSLRFCLLLEALGTVHLGQALIGPYPACSLRAQVSQQACEDFCSFDQEAALCLRSSRERMKTTNIFGNEH